MVGAIALVLVFLGGLVLKVFWIVIFIFAMIVPSHAQAEKPRALESLISPDTRLLIFSPHPDDESLGAAGLIQRVLKEGGKVRVVFLTNGDGFPEGVEREDHISHPTTKDYRRYREERRVEALKAVTILGMEERDVIFLGFPDGGLSFLHWKFLAGSPAYKSPFTLESRPPASKIIIPHTDYTGHDLIKEIKRVIADFRPSLMATTPPQDEHPDHSATYFFVREALAQVSKKNPNIKPRVLAFLIHFGQWPIAQGAGSGSRLDPPVGFPDKGTQWVSLPLKPEEVVTKRQAILEYYSQILVMGRYLLSFARSNELFIMEN